METKGRRRQPSIDLPTITTIHQPQPCDFEGTDASYGRNSETKKTNY